MESLLQSLTIPFRQKCKANYRTRYSLFADALMNSLRAQVNDLEDAIEQLKAATAVAADAADADLASNAARVNMICV